MFKFYFKMGFCFNQIVEILDFQGGRYRFIDLERAFY